MYIYHGKKEHFCGNVPSTTKGDTWYTIKCKVVGGAIKGGILGTEVKIVGTSGNNLSIAGIKVHGIKALTSAAYKKIRNNGFVYPGHKALQ